MSRDEKCFLTFRWATGAQSVRLVPAVWRGCWPSWSWRSNFWSRRRCRIVWFYCRKHLWRPPCRTSHRSLRNTTADTQVSHSNTFIDWVQILWGQLATCSGFCPLWQKAEDLWCEDETLIDIFTLFWHFIEQKTNQGLEKTIDSECLSLQLHKTKTLESGVFFIFQTNSNKGQQYNMLLSDRRTFYSEVTFLSD